MLSSSHGVYPSALISPFRHVTHVKCVSGTDKLLLTSLRRDTNLNILEFCPARTEDHLNPTQPETEVYLQICHP
jgi:hypothetical protein